MAARIDSTIYLDSLTGQAYISAMYTLSQEKRIAVLASLVEGNSLRATVRMTGVAKNTVVKLLVDLGRVCEDYQRKTLVNLRSRRIQCDEIWSFCYAKEKNVTPAMLERGWAGDVWTWTALCPDTKLVICWNVGRRDAKAAQSFMGDVASRLAKLNKVLSEPLLMSKPFVDFLWGDPELLGTHPLDGIAEEMAIYRPGKGG